MANVEESIAFSNGKQCLVCNGSSNVRSMPLYLNEKTYVAPVCDNNVCRNKSRNNKEGVSSAGLNASKLLETNVSKRLKNHSK
jgi:hypothetical protein